MNKKATLILLLSLLALVALVAPAAGAQDAPPDAPVMGGESGIPAANLTETESNNSFDRADLIGLGDVVAGVIGSKTDKDYYRIDIDDATTTVLIDIDAQVSGSAMDAAICLYDITLTELACNDDTDGYDSLLFALLYPDDAWPASPYYVRVQDGDYPNEGGPAYTYTLSVYQPMLISAATDGSVAGIPFTSADVLAHYDFRDGTEKWMMFFDASDVGITTNVIGLATKYNYEDIALVVAKPQTLPIGGTSQKVTPYDVLYFVAGQNGRFGPKTAGEFFIGFAGADFGLGGPGEKIDALTSPFQVSTDGEATLAGGQKARDEDISNLPYGYPDFDGSLVPGLGVEDTIAADDCTINGIRGVALTILGSGRVDGFRVTQKDIFFVPWGTTHVSGVVWRGSEHGFNYTIDAFDLAD